MGDRNGGPSTDDRRTSRRRFVLAAGTLVDSIGIASCTTSEPEREEATPTPSPSPTEPEPETETPAETPEPETDPPGEKRPMGEKYPDLRVVSTDPPVAEAASRETYTRYRTPIGEHYIVNHYDTPVLDADDWTITLTGLPGSDAEITMRELRREYSTTTITHTMQCAGNGRAYFEPEISGFSLSFGALGTSEWTGTPLRELLEAYDADAEAGWLMVAGADHPAGESVFARSIPLWKVLEDCILAYEMNGTPLPLEHGHPVRLVVPGWFGNNSVKWVGEMAVTDSMLIGEERARYQEWQQNRYRVLAAGEEADHNETIDRFDTWDQMEANLADEIDYAPYVYDQPVKSTIGHPGEGTIRLDRRGAEIDVVGVAWAGDERVERVEVSDDGGDTWRDAELVGPDRGAVAWRQFRYRWAPDPGEYRLVSRATDERDRTQPRAIAAPERGFRAIDDGDYPWNQRGYGSNAYLPLGVDVRVER